MPTSENSRRPPFEFRDPTKLPYIDDDAGIALMKAGMRGIFHAGVVHAFVMCGYYPRAISGTSAGALAGGILAMAVEIPEQPRRMQLVRDFIDAWCGRSRMVNGKPENPAEYVFEQLATGPFGNLVGELAQIDLTLGDIVDCIAGLGAAADDPPDDESTVEGWKRKANGLRALLRIVAALPYAAHKRIPYRRALESLSKLDGKMHAVQEIFAANGMQQSLIGKNVVESHFQHLFEQYAPRGTSSLMAHLRVDLIVTVANLSASKRLPPGDSDNQTTFSKKTPGTANAKLDKIIGAACAFAPLYPGQRMRDVLEGENKPDHCEWTDLLMDADTVAQDALAPLLGHFIGCGRSGPFRLFGVHLDPIAPVEYKPLPEPGSFVHPALHSLSLTSALDQRFPYRVIDLVTDLVEALQHAPGQPTRKRPDGQRYVAIHTTEIAPARPISYFSLSTPSETEMLEACALGCHGTLTALLKKQLDSDEFTGKLIQCKDLLKSLRDKRQGLEPGYFEPNRRICSHCSGEFARVSKPAEKSQTKSPITENDFHMFKGDKERPPPKFENKGLHVVVPAGGVFRGTFQVGSVAAFKDYQISPHLYAGASVGTIFSYLLDACIPDDDQHTAEARADAEAKFNKAVGYLLDIPRWVDQSTLPPLRPSSSLPKPKGFWGRFWGLDRAAQDTSPSPLPPGVVDQLRDKLRTRWNSEEVKPLRDLRPARIVEMLKQPQNGAHWFMFRDGLNALLFKDKPSLALSRAEVRDLFTNLAQMRLHECVHAIDKIAFALGFAPGSISEDAEILGFRSIADLIRTIAFAAQPGISLVEHEQSTKAKFIFTTTNHTDGKPEFFGMDDPDTPRYASPIAVEACLAASAFPIAFRRRKYSEIFGSESDPPGRLYADGGVFNNFPSDTALTYLHQLSGKDGTKWIGDKVHSMYLLSLTSGMNAPDTGAEDALVFVLARSRALSDTEKVLKTLRMQRHINHLAPMANPLMTCQPERAIVAQTYLISPVQETYPHAFAFKPYLGFRKYKQLTMLAAGCRRTRLALEWPKYLDKNGIGNTYAEEQKRIEDFRKDVLEEMQMTAGSFQNKVPSPCIFGRFSYEGKAKQCSFASSYPDVYAQCKRDFKDDMKVADLKLMTLRVPEKKL